MKKSSLRESFQSALAGLLYCLRTQRNFRLHLLAAFFVFALAYFLGLGQGEILILILTVFFVIVLEMTNTAVEALIDLVAPRRKRKAKIAKDITAAVVLLAAIGAVAIGLFIFGPPIKSLITNH